MCHSPQAAKPIKPQAHQQKRQHAGTQCQPPASPQQRPKSRPVLPMDQAKARWQCIGKTSLTQKTKGALQVTKRPPPLASRPERRGPMAGQAKRYATRAGTDIGQPSAHRSATSQMPTPHSANPTCSAAPNEAGKRAADRHHRTHSEPKLTRVAARLVPATAPYQQPTG